MILEQASSSSSRISSAIPHDSGSVSLEDEPVARRNSTVAVVDGPTAPPRSEQFLARMEFRSNRRDLIGSLSFSSTPQSLTDVIVIMYPTGTTGQEGKSYVGFLSMDVDWSSDALKKAVTGAAKQGDGSHKSVEKLSMMSGPVDDPNSHTLTAVEEENCKEILEVLMEGHGRCGLVAKLEI